MRSLLIVLSVAEIVIVVAVLAGYLIAIRRSLARTATLLGKVTFGVRAIETECAPIGPTVLQINSQLRDISAALATTTSLAEAQLTGAGGHYDR